jgi:hypothetical protein
LKSLEAGGGGIMVSVFFLGVLLLCVVGCDVHKVTIG